MIKGIFLLLVFVFLPIFFVYIMSDKKIMFLGLAKLPYRYFKLFVIFWTIGWLVVAVSLLFKASRGAV